MLTLSPGCSSLCWYECACVHTYTLPTETRREGHGTTFKSIRRVYAPRFLSRHNKDLEWWTLKPPRRVTALGSWTDRVIALRSQTDHVIALRQISVTVLQLNVTDLFFFFFNFTILYWFCHTSTWIHHGCTHVPNPEPPSLYLEDSRKNPSLRHEGMSIQRCEEKSTPARGRETDS